MLLDPAFLNPKIRYRLANLCLLTEEFHLFTVKVITDAEVFTTAILCMSSGFCPSFLHLLLPVSFFDFFVVICFDFLLFYFWVHSVDIFILVISIKQNTL